MLKLKTMVLLRVTNLTILWLNTGTLLKHSGYIKESMVCVLTRYLKIWLMELRLTKGSGICHVAQNTVNEEAKNLASFVSYLRKEDVGRLLFFFRGKN